MVDSKTELSSYHHHNKLYQYLALGKPVVIQRNHNDYDYLKNCIYIAYDKIEYKKVLSKAIRELGCKDKEMERVKLAIENNSQKRAIEFLDIVYDNLKSKKSNCSDFNNFANI